VDFTPSTSAVQFGDEVRELIASVFTDDVRQRVHDTGTMHDWGLHRAMAAKGWIEQALPEALGGGGRDPEELAVLFRELELAGAPYDGLSICTMVASVIAHVGNEMQRRVVLPKLLAGESLIALGYSEPDSGSDVAAARTRAVRDGDGWRIDGQKIFTSLAEESEWVFLLTRTDLDVAKHQGLTFFLVPTSAPGFELQPIRTLSGKRTNTTFYDGVHVDDEWRVGDVNGGWQVMLVALSFERGVAGGVRDAERLLAVAEAHARDAVDDDGRPLLDDPDRRDALIRLAIDCEVTDLLASRAAWVAASGRLPGVEGAATKLFATEALQRAVDRLLDAAGPAGLVQSDDVRDLSAFYEYCYRFAPVTTIYGGTSEIQRNLIAQRGLGLPRAR
jgi:alkylation response protein AidB-like acyl-CoA dehydrogenase